MSTAEDDRTGVDDSDPVAGPAGGAPEARVDDRAGDAVDEPENDDPAPPDAIDVETLLDDLDRVSGERDGYLADLQRVSAEFANFRKQTDKRQHDVVQQAAARLAEALLPVLDACEAAALQGVEGVEPVKGQLLGVLEREGLEVVDATDDPFDPNRHDAVMHEPGEDGQDESIVAEVLRTGYVWHGKVLRPAMVRVRG